MSSPAVARGPAVGEAIEIFYSYAHEDEDLRLELEKHLSVLRRTGVITGWTDRQIKVGTEWRGAIDTHLRSAQIILLLVSADFLASDYCYDVEMTLALERHRRGEAVVIPIILRPVDWKRAPFADLQVLPKDGVPAASWPDIDAAFADVARAIRALAQSWAPVTETRDPTHPRRPLLADQHQERVLDAGLPARVVMGRPVELLAMIRRSQSGGLRALVSIEPEPPLAGEEVRSRPFRMEFPLDVAGRATALKATLRVDSPQFEPKSQSRNLRVPPDGDSEVCTFLMTACQKGELRVSLEVLVGDLFAASRTLRTSADAEGAEAPAVRFAVVTMPLFTVASTSFPVLAAAKPPSASTREPYESDAADVLATPEPGSEDVLVSDKGGPAPRRFPFAGAAGVAAMALAVGFALITQLRPNAGPIVPPAETTPTPMAHGTPGAGVTVPPTESTPWTASTVPPLESSPSTVPTAPPMIAPTPPVTGSEVSGKVIDARGNPVDGILVFVEGRRAEMSGASFRVPRRLLPTALGDRLSVEIRRGGRLVYRGSIPLAHEPVVVRIPN